MPWPAAAASVERHRGWRGRDALRPAAAKIVSAIGSTKPLRPAAFPWLFGFADLIDWPFAGWRDGNRGCVSYPSRARPSARGARRAVITGRLGGSDCISRQWSNGGLPSRQVDNASVGAAGCFDPLCVQRVLDRFRWWNVSFFEAAIFYCGAGRRVSALAFRGQIGRSCEMSVSLTEPGCRRS